MHACMRCGRSTRSARFLSRPARFSRTIAQRHAARHAYGGVRLAMLVAQRWTRVASLHRHWQQWLLTIAPRIELRVSAPASMPVAGGAQATGIAPRIDRDSVDYAQARARRIDTGFDDLVMSKIPPVPRVLQRRAPPVAVEDADARSPGAPSRLAQCEGVMPRPRAVASRVAPDLNVERLTEQVIKGIDRRIIAQRERLGRF